MKWPRLTKQALATVRLHVKLIRLPRVRSRAEGEHMANAVASLMASQGVAYLVAVVVVVAAVNTEVIGCNCCTKLKVSKSVY